MKKQMRELRVDPDLQGLSRQMDAEEWMTLEDSIRTHGCVEPLAVWNKTIVDGHKRYVICQKYGIPFAVQRLEFESRDEAARWILGRLLSCPGLGKYERAEIILRYAPFLHKKAEQRKPITLSAGLNQRRPKQGKTRERLARMAGVSHGTLDKVEYIGKYGDQAIIGKLRRGELSIHRAFCILRKRKNAWRLGGLS